MKKHMILNHSTVMVMNGKIETITKEREVRVMAIAEKYAMVRFKGCMPFVVRESELKELENTK